MKKKQLNFFSGSQHRRSHGGKISGKRKRERPLDTRKWIHLVFKSDVARGVTSLYRHQAMIKMLLRVLSRRFFVHIKAQEIMHNHIHLQVRIQSRQTFQNVLRSFASISSRKISGARKGQRRAPFWSGLAWTRVLMSSLEEWILRRYFRCHAIEREQGYGAREVARRAGWDWVYGPG